MNRSVLTALLLVGCGTDGGDSTTPLSTQAALKVTTQKAQTDNYVDFGEPRFVVEVSDADDCFVPRDSFGGTFRGVAMDIIQRGALKDGSCVPTRLAIPFEAVTAANDIVEVHDADASVTATFDASVLDVRAATFDWTFRAGSTNVIGWSHPIQGTPKLSFCIPVMNGAEAGGGVWNNFATGVVSDLIIHFSLPAQMPLRFGEAMIEAGGAEGTATSCTGSACTYDLDYFVIHGTTVNP